MQYRSGSGAATRDHYVSSQASHRYQGVSDHHLNQEVPLMSDNFHHAPGHEDDDISGEQLNIFSSEGGGGLIYQEDDLHQ